MGGDGAPRRAVAQHKLMLRKSLHVFTCRAHLTRSSRKFPRGRIHVERARWGLFRSNQPRRPVFHPLGRNAPRARGAHSSRLTYLPPAEGKHAPSEAAEGDGTLSSRLTYLPPAEVMPAFSLHGGSNQWQLSSPKPLSWPDSFQS